jgi:hypothetical protein
VGDVLWVWAEIETIAAPTTASVAPNRRDVFISDRDWSQGNRTAKKTITAVVAADVKTVAQPGKYVPL